MIGEIVELFLLIIILLGIGFGLLCPVFGYIYGFFKIFLSSWLLKDFLDFSWLSWFWKLRPDRTFLSDIATIESVLVGVTIPISLQIVIWVVDKYKDQELAGIFTKEKLYTAQYWLFFPNIILAIGLEFLSIENAIVLWIVLVWFVVNVIVFGFFLNLVKKYVVSTDNVFIKKLQNYAQGIIHVFPKNKTVARIRDCFYFTLEKLTNIARVKVELGDTETAKKILGEIEKIFKQFWYLKKINPDKFKTFLWSKDFYDNFVEPIQIQNAETDSPAKNADELRREAGFRLFFAPEIQMKGLTQCLSSYEKIWRVAYKCKNNEIGKYVIYQLNALISELVQEVENELFIEQFLRTLNLISVAAIKELKKTGEIDSSVYAATIYWYTDIVFNRLRRSGKGFNLSYLELFNKHLFSVTRYIISENQTVIFNSLVSTLIDGIRVPDYYRGEVLKYGYLIPQKYQQRGIEKCVKELDDSKNDLCTKEKLELWLKKFEELKTIIEQDLNEEQKEEAQKIEEKIKNFATSQFKYQNLLEVAFVVGAYCLFKQRYDYIKYLWEYKQPPDSGGLWIGHDITPRTLDEIMRFYFRQEVLAEKFPFWEGHHGSIKYCKQYFLLLLARVLQGFPIDAKGKCSQIEEYELRDLHAYELNELEHSVDGFIQLTNALKKTEGTLAEIGFGVTKLDELFNAKLVPFLKKLKEEAQKRISATHKSGNICSKKVEEFKSKLLKAFDDAAILRGIFKYFKAYNESKIQDKIIGEKERSGIYLIDDKASFFDAWPVYYVGFGESYGRDIASWEDSYLLNSIEKNCKEITKNDFETTLSKFEKLEDIVIFATNVAFWRFFDNFKNFKPKWCPDVKPLEVKGFGGWYDFNGQLIPIFETYHQKIDKQILILDKTKIGELIQLSPLNEGEGENSVVNIFYMDIQAFSENKELMNFIKESPEWLQKIGNEQKQQEYLLERVRIQVCERFEYIQSKDFEGYKLFLEED